MVLTVLTSPPGSPQPELPGERLTRFLAHTMAWLSAHPWIAAVPLALLVAAMVTRGVWLRRRQSRLARHARC